MVYLYLITSLLLSALTSIGAFLLIRSTSRGFKEKRMVKSIGLSVALLLVVVITLVFINTLIWQIIYLFK